MNREEPTIEAEVVEIDGVAVEPRPTKEPQRPHARWQSWNTWQGRMKKLDSRWWPLWLILGFFALVLIVAIGMVAAVLFITFRIIMGIINGLANLIFPSHELQRR